MGDQQQDEMDYPARVSSEHNSGNTIFEGLNARAEERGWVVEVLPLVAGQGWGLVKREV